MARILSEAGFFEVWCTPHLIKGFYEASSGAVRAAVANLQREIDTAGIPLTLHPGREYHLDEFLPSFLAEPLPIGERHLLVEPPFYGNPETIPEARFILLWGANSVSTNIHLMSMIQKARQRGAKLVVVDVRLARR